MRTLFRFLARNHVFILFLALEVFALVLVFNFNNYQKVRFLNTSNYITGSIYNRYNRVVNYFRLGKINNQLAIENAVLKDELANYRQWYFEIDSLRRMVRLDSGKYSYTSALVINNSIHKEHNYITLNKGRRSGILPDQGIVSGNAVVGIVSNVTSSYSIGLSLLNKRVRVSGKLKKNNYYGSVTWEGGSYQYVRLNEIPPHVQLTVGDTVVTSGASTYFPEGLMIGTIDTFDIRNGESFYNIRVKLAVDFKSVTYVEVITNFDKSEIQTLESLTQNGQDMD